MCVFFAGNFGSLETQNIPKSAKKNISDGGKKKSVTGWQEFVEHVCQISGSYLKKRRGRWMLNKFGAVSLNQPVFILLNTVILYLVRTVRSA